MRVNPLRLVLCMAIACLIGFGFHELSRQNESEITLVSAIASGVFMSILGAIDIGAERANVNIKIMSLIGILASLFISFIFAMIPISVNYYFIAMGIIAVFTIYIINLLSDTE